MKSFLDCSSIPLKSRVKVFMQDWGENGTNLIKVEFLKKFYFEVYLYSFMF